MKKSLLIAVGMACVLFVYGWMASSMGHDHGSHSDGAHSHATKDHH